MEDVWRSTGCLFCSSPGSCSWPGLESRIQGEVSFGLTQHWPSMYSHLKSVQLGIAGRNCLSGSGSVLRSLFHYSVRKIGVSEEGFAGIWTWEPKVHANCWWEFFFLAFFSWKLIKYPRKCSLVRKSKESSVDSVLSWLLLVSAAELGFTQICSVSPILACRLLNHLPEISPATLNTPGTCAEWFSSWSSFSDFHIFFYVFPRRALQLVVNLVTTGLVESD